MTTLTQTQAGLPTGTWSLDSVHSQIGFAIEYVGGTFRGTFSPVDASLEVDAAGIASLQGRALAESIHVQDENLTAHLMAPDFFDAERVPELGFASKAIRAEGGAVAIDGELTLRGVTLPVELTGTANGPVQDAYGNDRVILTLEATIDRAQFGFDWNAPLPDGRHALANDVTLSAELFFVRKQA
jgi:polyisoprenoid-binding protein YceI